ncbi:MAG: hypothetical protein RI922_2910 [Bacteroidota bacterium]
MDSILRANNPGLPSKDEFELWMQNEIANNSSAHIIGGVYYIPVVVHVIHNGEAVGTGTNVSFAAIQSQIDVLNEDFRKMLGTNGWNTNPVGADTKIEFCLAQRRPDGSAFAAGEPGVNRINRTTAGFSTPPYTTTYIDATIKPWTYNGNVPTATRGWDPNKYMNIWLCNISGGILGYAQFPQSPLGGMGCTAPAAATDGVVFLYNSIGKSSVTGFAGPYNEGRTATHEIGHWLGLRHIWGDGGCTVDDFCNDTPEAAAANFGCPAGTNSCTAAPDAGPDMIENYMDYTDDLCMNIFTNDQKTRMRTVLESSPLRASLINSDACTPPNANDASVVNVVNPKGDNCAGSITPTVTLRNRGASNLTSATISYKIDNGAATTFAWTGSILPGASLNVALPAFTTTLGTHNFKAYSTLPNGVTDPSTIYDTSAIDFVISNGETAPFVENFEGSVFPPDVRWVIDNANSDCFQWVGASATSITGIFNNNTAQFPGFGNTSASTDNLITPIFILPCNATAANIQFDVAYRRRNTTTTNYDRLYVEISEDCGTTWNATPIYDKTGTTLQVLTTVLSTYYTPVGATDWRTETIDLLPYVTGTSKNIKFRIRAVAANGNNIYIDNFKFNATTPGEIEVTQSGNDILDGGAYNYGTVAAGSSNTATFTITNTGTSNLILTAPISITGTGFSLGSSFGTTTVAAGATTTFSVVFSSSTAGTFTGNVSFATNDCDEGTYNFVLNAIVTGGAPTASFTATPTTVCAGQTVIFTNTSTGTPTSYAWTFTGGTPATSTAANPTVTYATAGTYTVALTATNGSGSNTSTQTNYITVNAAPATPGTITGSATACTGSTGNVYSIAAVAGATSYTWTVPAGATITAGQGTTSATVTFGTTSGNVSVTATNACGTSTASVKAVTLNSAPATPGTITGSATACTGSTGNVYSITAVAGATSYTWTVPAGATVTAGQGTTSATVTFGSTSGNVTVTATNSCGTSTASTLAVTLNSVPATPGTITGSATACPSSTGNVYSIVAVAGATSYTWTVPAGATITAGQGTTSATVNFGSTSGNVTVTATNSCGTSTASTLAVTISSTAPATPGAITGTTAVCSGSTGNIYSIAAVAGATSYTWTVPAGATITAGQGTTSATITFGTTAGNITVTAASACGTSAASSQAITITTVPATPGTITGSATACTGSTGNVYSITAVAGATSYTWTVPAGATITAGQGTTSATVSFGSTSGNVSVTATNACGTSTASVKAVTLSSAPATPGTISGSATACTGSTGNVYSIAAVAGATSYTWTVPAGATFTAGQGTTSATVTFGSTSGNVTVTATNSCGTSTASTLAVTLNSVPATPGTITGSATACPSSTGNVYSIAAVAAATSYTWTVPTGATIAAGQGTTSVTVTFGSTSGNVTVTATNSCGTSAASTLAITMNSVPPTPGAITGTSTVCASSAGNVYSIAAVSGATSYTWTVPAGATITAGQGTTSATVTFGSTSGNVSVTASNTCGTSLSSDLLVNINALPSVPGSITGNSTVCENSTSQAYTIPTTLGTIAYTWSIPVGSTIVSGQGSNAILVDFGSTSGSISVTQTNSCGTSAASSIAITVNAIPSTPTTSVVDNCGSSDLSVNATGTINWSTGQSSTSINVTTAGTYTVSQTINGCTSALASVLANPTAIPAAPSVSVLNKCGTADLSASSTGSLMWSTGETNQTITVTLPGTYFVSQTVNGCTSPTASAIAAPFSNPAVTFTPLNDVCINSPVFTLTEGSPAGGTYAGTGVSSNQFDPSVAGYGVFTITYTYTDNNGCAGTNQQPITVGCAGVSENLANEFTIYPNPTSGQFTISSSLELISEIKIYDETGRLVQVISKNENQVNIDLSACADGIYSLEIQTALGTARERIVLNK